MYRSLYKYKATYPAALSFEPGDVFLDIPSAKQDKNWHFVTAISGRSGFVPRNYVESIELREDEVVEHVTRILASLHTNNQLTKIERQETIKHLEQLKTASAAKPAAKVNDARPLIDMKKATGSRESLSSVRSSCKKRAAPQPPGPASRLSDGTGSECSNSPRLSPRPPSSTGGCSEDRDATLQESAHEEMNLSRQISECSSNTSLKIPGEVSKFSHQTSMSSVSTDSAVTDLRSESSDLVTVTYRHPQESCRAKALDMVEMTRGRTGLSHETSTNLLQLILNDLVTSQKDLNVLVPSLMKELEDDLFSQDEILGSGDYTTLTDLFNKLSQAKDDEQQRNWMLYEDEETITDNLNKLGKVLANAKIEISKKVIREYKYCSVQNLVEYFQMETRWNIRKILIETFSTIATIDNTVISLMLNSVLPLELVQTMFENPGSVCRLKHSAILLTIIFSQGEGVPVHYLESHLGTTFVDFLLNGLENPPDGEEDDSLPDVYMGLIASYNLQFKDTSSNLVLEALSKVSSAKMLTEKLLLLLNREEDPAQLLGDPSQLLGEPSQQLGDPSQLQEVPGQLRQTEKGINSVHKLVLDVFSREECIPLFYTNDLMVLIDIIARQLCDLGPGLERYTYLEMAHLVLARSGYDDHLHRLNDLKVCLQRIEGEEGQSVEKLKVQEICSSFSCFKS